MNEFLDTLAYICSRALNVAIIYFILKLVFHYVCTPFEIYVILTLQGLALHSGIVQIVRPENEEGNQ